MASPIPDTPDPNLTPDPNPGSGSQGGGTKVVVPLQQLHVL